MRPGQAYLGSPPVPAATASLIRAYTVASPPMGDIMNDDVVTHGSNVRAAAEWARLSRYVATNYARPPRTSVLPAGGSTLAAPQWLACAGKPVAVLADLEAVVPANGPVPDRIGSVLGAVETLQVTVVYMTRRIGEQLATSLAALRRAELRRPAPGRTLLSVPPDRSAVPRAAAGARYCVIALAGHRAEDFPDNASPDPGGKPSNSGWFRVGLVP